MLIVYATSLSYADDDMKVVELRGDLTRNQRTTPNYLEINDCAMDLIEFTVEWSEQPIEYFYAKGLKPDESTDKKLGFILFNNDPYKDNNGDGVTDEDDVDILAGRYNSMVYNFGLEDREINTFFVGITTNPSCWTGEYRAHLATSYNRYDFSDIMYASRYTKKDGRDLAVIDLGNTLVPNPIDIEWY